MEVSLSTELGVGKEVNESSLLNVLVFLVNSIILELLFGVSKMLVLDHLNVISPLVGQLLELVCRVHIIEY
jgi:hypothetical protein